jgi:hypothetical protein
MANKRVFYACKRVDFSPSNAFTTLTALHGVQSVGINTTFNLTPIFELGQLEIYENIEGVPNVEISLERVLDGSCPAWCLATKTASTPTLVGRSNEKVNVHLGIWNDTDTSTNTSPLSRMQASGMFPSSVGIEIPLQGPMTESISFVGNNIQWAGSYNGAPAIGDLSFGSWATSDSPLAANGSGGVNQRDNLLFGINNSSSGLDSNGTVRDPDITVLPQDIRGVSSSGTNGIDANGDFGVHVSRMSARVDLGREEMFELGRLGAYHRFVTFPVEVTTEIEIYCVSGAMVSATEFGITAGTAGAFCSDRYNLQNRTIRMATCEGTRLYLGKKNKLQSVNMGGGDAGGGNDTITYVYSNYNDFTLMHYNDATAALRPGGGSVLKHDYLAPS